MNTLRFYYRQAGGHTHVRVFCGPSGQTAGKCGDLVFRNEEWDDIQRLLRNAEFRPEPKPRFSRRHDDE